MSGGGENGADLGAVYALLREVAATVTAQERTPEAYGRALRAIDDRPRSMTERLV